MIYLFGNIALWVGAFSALLFCVAYHWSARWWTSPEGRHLMSFTASLALIMLWLTYRNLTTATPPISLGDSISRTAIYTVIAINLLWRLQLLWRRQIKPGLWRRKEADRA